MATLADGHNGSSLGGPSSSRNRDRRRGSNVADANGDVDGDLIPNGLEIQNGLNPLSAADGTADKDGDGLCNRGEAHREYFRG